MKRDRRKTILSRPEQGITTVCLEACGRYTVRRYSRLSSQNFILSHLTFIAPPADSLSRKSTTTLPMPSSQWLTLLDLRYFRTSTRNFVVFPHATSVGHRSVNGQDGELLRLRRRCLRTTKGQILIRKTMCNTALL